MLTLLIRARCYHGAFPHFLDGRSGETIPFMRKDDGGDLVETSLLCMGLLCARAYFSADTPVEQRVRGQIRHSLGRSRMELVHPRRPRGALLALEPVQRLGHRSRDPWLERVPDHLRAGGLLAHAMASIRSPIIAALRAAPSTATAAVSTASSCRSGRPMAARCSSRITPSAGSTRADLRDRYADYWQQNVQPRAHQSRALRRQSQRLRWLRPGLLGPHLERRPGGLCAPCARRRRRHHLARPPRSRAFRMRRSEAMRALRHFLHTYGDRIWGRYGFIDAFCEQRGLVRRHLPGDRSGADHRHDRELPHRPAVEAVHAASRRCSAGCAGSASRARISAAGRAHDAPRSRAGSSASIAMRCAGMLASISAVDLVKKPAGLRPGDPSAARRRWSPRRCSAPTTPIPDYFFHWYRDSAIVIDALRLLFEDGRVGAEALEAPGRLRAVSAARCSGSTGARWWQRPPGAPRSHRDFERYLRSGRRARARCMARRSPPRRASIPTARSTSPPGPARSMTAPALRALALLRWLRALERSRRRRSFGAGAALALEACCARISPTRAALRASPASTSGRRRTGCTTTRCAWPPRRSIRARAGSRTQGDRSAARRPVAAEARGHPAALWIDTGLPAEGYYRSRVLESGARSAKELDIAVILAAVHAGGSGAPLGARSAHACHARAAGGAVRCANTRSIARASGPRRRRMGRYAGRSLLFGRRLLLLDLGAAEFCFRAATGHRPRRSRCARARRCVPRDGAGVHAGERRAVRAIRSPHRRARPPPSSSAGAMRPSSPASPHGAPSAARPSLQDGEVGAAAGRLVTRRLAA